MVQRPKGKWSKGLRHFGFASRFGPKAEGKLIKLRSDSAFVLKKCKNVGFVYPGELFQESGWYW